MEEWKEYKLGEVCTISSSKRIFANEYQNSGIPFYRGKEIIEKHNGTNISNELFISEEKYNEIKNKFGAPKEGDLLLSSVGTLGVPYIVRDETFYFKDGNLTWFYDYEGINNFFLYYWFLSPKARFYIDTKAIGSTQKALTIETLKKFEILLPSLPTQQKIVSILKSLDDKIEVNRKINQNLEQQAQALFKSWFVDFEPFKNGEFVESELGMIPKGWRLERIEDLSQKMASGGTPKSLNKDYYLGNIKWYSTKELKDCFLFDSEKHISEDALKNSSAKMFPEGTVLMAIYASPTVGRLGILTNPATFNQAAVGIVPKENVGSEFIYLSLLSERTNLNNLASGAAQQNLNVGIVKNYNILVPEQKALDRFNRLARSYFLLLRKNTEESRRLAEIRDTLLPKLMSGELKVTNMDLVNEMLEKGIR